jgi:outer membrane protein OmpA-like peptidoglycan-associated protein
MRRLALVVALAAGVAAGLVPAWPAGAQDGGDGGDGEGGRERTAELRFRVVDLGVRSAATDDSEQTTEMPDHTTITYASDVLFDVDRSDLNSDARRLIGALADELTELGPRTVTIQGHTDDSGEPGYNQRLSERRAEAVRAHLAVRLDDEFRFEVAGYGESRPVAPNDSDEGRARNRRVVISYPTG